MELVAKNSKWAMVLAVVSVGWMTASFAQEQVVEYGRVVQADDGTGSLDYLIGYDNQTATVSEKKAWLPILSPLMICLDCWITKTVDIHQFYSQQAADEYFAMAESCADLPLSMDPNILRNTGLKYTVLAPIYAHCPSLLNRRGILGGGGGYGVPSPIPSVAATGMNAPMAPSTMQAPAETVNAPASGGLQPMPAASTTSKMKPPSTPEKEHMASSGKWSQMSDEEILAHFGLDPQIATRAKQVAEMDGQKLEEPVAETVEWQFADEAPTVRIDRSEVVALNHDSFPPKVEPLELPRPVEIREPEPVPFEKLSERPTIEIDFDETTEVLEEGRKPFSTTDAEYDRMRQIEQDLLSY